MQTYSMEAGPAVILPSNGAATIWGQYGAKLNTSMLETPEEFAGQPYITASYDLTAFGSTDGYSINEQHSWSAAVEILEGVSPFFERRSGPFFGHTVSTIAKLKENLIVTPQDACSTAATKDCTMVWPEEVDFTA
ncbi:hypothetical protein JCM8547_005430 [Rhodosporidiobolus lusitaniae]